MGGPFLHHENQRPGRPNLILRPNEDQAKYCRENVHKGVAKTDSRLDITALSSGAFCRGASEAGPTWG